jgi:hypothetical protein
MQLNTGLNWTEVTSRLRESWEHVAPAALRSRLRPSP